MTHPNILVHQTIKLYQLTIHFLLKNINDPNRAKYAFDFAVKKSKEDGFNEVTKEGQSCEVWLELALKLSSQEKIESNSDFPEEDLNCREKDGWLQRAFVLSFFYLSRHRAYNQKDQEAQFFKDAMRSIIREGGDTDTNAAIVGGMIGALVGLSKIDETMRNKVLSFDCTKPAT